MTPAPAETAEAGTHAKVCAGLAFASVAAHAAMAWAHRTMPVEAALMVLMALACLPCALAVWRGAHGRGTRLLLAMALAMAVVHTALLLLPAGGAHVHLGAGAAMAGMTMSGPQVPAVAVPVPGMPGMPGGSAAGMLGVIVLEFAVAAASAALLRRRRVRAAATSPVAF